MHKVDPPFPEAMPDRLFDYILENDVVTEDCVPPADIPMQFSDTEIVDAFRLARQLFSRRLDINLFRRLTATLAIKSDLSAPDRLAFKHARAKFKQVRFAKANFDKRHVYPPCLNLTTAVLGHLQDDFKNGHSVRTRARGVLACALLSPVPFMLILRELRDFRPVSADGLREWTGDENRRLQNIMAKPELTAREFHSTRKIISRRVSLYDTLRVITPSPALDQTSRFLATLNGLMGALHDKLVEEKARGARDYNNEVFPMPRNIRDRLTALVAALGQ
mgnify:CR=1 FL=1